MARRVHAVFAARLACANVGLMVEGIEVMPLPLLVAVKETCRKAMSHRLRWRPGQPDAGIARRRCTMRLAI